MARRKGSEAERVAQNGLEARLELLIRNTAFKQDLVEGRRLYAQYQKAPTTIYAPLYANPEVSLERRRQHYQQAHGESHRPLTSISSDRRRTSSKTSSKCNMTSSWPNGISTGGRGNIWIPKIWIFQTSPPMS